VSVVCNYVCLYVGLFACFFKENLVAVVLLPDPFQKIEARTNSTVTHQSDHHLRSHWKFRATKANSKSERDRKDLFAVSWSWYLDK